MKINKNIPNGIYCYDENGLCPYWNIDEKHEIQDNGFCKYLQIGDWQLGFGLLWDKVKECNINLEDN